MMIFIEGIDKAGKTTLATALSASTGIPVYRKIPPKLTDTERHTFFKGVGYAVNEIHNVLNFNLIVDRSFISDWVYSNKSGLYRDLIIWEEWERRLKSPKDVLLLYVHIDQPTFEERITNDPDRYMDIKDYSRFMQLYEAYLAETRLPVIRVRGDVPFDEQLRYLWTFLSCYNLPKF